MLRQHLRIGLRSLLHSPGFTLTTVLTLALGIGLATAVWTVANTLLLRPLPMRDQGRLITVWASLPDRGFDNLPGGIEDVKGLSRRTRTMERVAGFDYHGSTPVLIRDGKDLSRLRRVLVTGEFFNVLGSRPLIGRSLRPDDDVAGAPPAMVLSYSGWQRRFAGDSAVLGRRLAIHETGVTYTVVGVMPRGLDFPRGVDFWVPVAPSASPAIAKFLELDMVARLTPGATPSQARDEATAFFTRPEVTSPWSQNIHGVVHPLPALILGETRPAVLVFTAAAALLLLIACINVAGILLVRGLARMREVAIRSALGAARRQIVAQLLTENVLLAIAGGVLGIGLAAAVIQVFVAIAPADLPRLEEIQINWAAVAGAFGITAIAVMIFALAPAILAARTGAEAALRSTQRLTGGKSSRLAGEGLVIGQLAVALMVLSAAGLITRSLINLERAELSLEPSNLLIAELALRADQYDSTANRIRMLDLLVPRIRALPGVRAVSPLVSVPFTPGWYARPGSEGQTVAEAAANPMLNMEVIGPGYFEALGLQLTRGRAFTDADREGAPPVVMVSEAAARHYWPGADPIGRRLLMGGNLEMPFTVIGVVPDTRYHDLPEIRPSFYFALQQASFFPTAPATLAIRTTETPAQLVPSIRAAIAETVPGVALASAAPFDRFLDRPLAQPRLNALLLALFAGAALAIAGVGLFGTMATMVRQRTRELGVRMALGATAKELGTMVMKRALGIGTLGAALGLAGAIALNRGLATLLYEITPTDLATLATVTSILLVIAVVASLLPARASAKVDPMVVLRSD